jgi:predicted acylesterase/phospholipase RssA
MLNDRILSLSCAGGGSRGILQAGYLKAISERNLKPDIIFGSSVGCLNACLYIQGDLDKMEQLWMTVRNEDVYKVNYLMLPALLFKHNAAFNSAPLAKLIDKYIDFEKIKASPIEFVIGTTNLTESKSELFNPKDLDEKTFKRVLLASASPPMAFPPVELKPKTFYGDSGLLNNFGISVGIKRGADYILVLTPTVPEQNKVENVLDMFSILTSVPEYGYLDRELSFIERLNEIQDYVPQLRDIQCLVIRPPGPTGIQLLDFSFAGKNRKELFEGAYAMAHDKLEGWLKS